MKIHLHTKITTQFGYLDGDGNLIEVHTVEAQTGKLSSEVFRELSLSLMEAKENWQPEQAPKQGE